MISVVTRLQIKSCIVFPTQKSRKAAAQLGAIDDGCFRYTKEQAEAVLANVKEESKARHKRKLENFVNLPHRKWRNPIFYKFDGSHGKSAYLSPCFVQAFNDSSNSQGFSCLRDWTEFSKKGILENISQTFSKI